MQTKIPYLVNDNVQKSTKQITSCANLSKTSLHQPNEWSFKSAKLHKTLNSIPILVAKLYLRLRPRWSIKILWEQINHRLAQLKDEIFSLNLMKLTWTDPLSESFLRLIWFLMYQLQAELKNLFWAY